MRPIEGLRADDVTELRDEVRRLSRRAAKLALLLQALLAGRSAEA